MREKIRLSDSIPAIIVKMVEGNPGAATVIGLLLKDEAMGMFDLLHADDMNIRGPQLWLAYKDHCGQDVEKLRASLRSRDPEMVATINRNYDKYVAVTSAASYR